MLHRAQNKPNICENSLWDRISFLCTDNAYNALKEGKCNLVQTYQILALIMEWKRNKRLSKKKKKRIYSFRTAERLSLALTSHSDISVGVCWNYSMSLTKIGWFRWTGLLILLPQNNFAKHNLEKHSHNQRGKRFIIHRNTKFWNTSLFNSNRNIRLAAVQDVQIINNHSAEVCVFTNRKVPPFQQAANRTVRLKITLNERSK